MDFLKSKSILIADDDEDIREVLQDYLGSYVKDLYLADNGIKALQLLEKHPIDLTILDINMPEMNGFELLGKIRWNFPKVFNIVISGDAMGEIKKDDILFQGYDFLLKPFDKEKLFSVIRSVFHVEAKIEDNQPVHRKRNAPGARIKPRDRGDRIVYDRRMRIWMSYYKQLVNFRKNNPNSWPRYREVWRKKNIGYWSSVQRNYYRKRLQGKETPLTDEQISLLSEISFPWTVKRETWLEQYEKLTNFREKHPDRWPRCWGEEQKLGIWCSFQRTQYRKFLRGDKNLLTDEKIEQLNAINFSWVLEKENKD